MTADSQEWRSFMESEFHWRLPDPQLLIRTAAHLEMLVSSLQAERETRRKGVTAKHIDTAYAVGLTILTAEGALDTVRHYLPKLAVA